VQPLLQRTLFADERLARASVITQNRPLKIT